MGDRPDYDNGMRYIDGELWRFIEQFKEMGEFKDNTEAQRKLVQKLRNIPVKYLLTDQLTVVEPETVKERNRKGTGLTF